MTHSSILLQAHLEQALRVPGNIVVKLLRHLQTAVATSAHNAWHCQQAVTFNWLTSWLRLFNLRCLACCSFSLAAAASALRCVSFSARS